MRGKEKRKHEMDDPDTHNPAQHRSPPKMKRQTCIQSVNCCPLFHVTHMLLPSTTKLCGGPCLSVRIPHFMRSFFLARTRSGAKRNGAHPPLAVVINNSIIGEDRRKLPRLHRGIFIRWLNNK